MSFLRRMKRIPWAGKKRNEEVLSAPKERNYDKI